MTAKKRSNLSQWKIRWGITEDIEETSAQEDESNEPGPSQQSQGPRNTVRGRGRSRTREGIHRRDVTLIGTKMLCQPYFPNLMKKIEIIH